MGIKVEFHSTSFFARTAPKKFFLYDKSNGHTKKSTVDFPLPLEISHLTSFPTTGIPLVLGKGSR